MKNYPWTNWRSIGNGTSVNASHIGEALVCDLGDDVSYQNAECHVSQRHEVHRQAAFLKRFEESWSYLQTNSGDEQNQSELLDNVEHLGVKRHA